MKWSIYLIYNKKTFRRYVGVTKNFNIRIKNHLFRMSNGDHHDLAVEDYKAYGLESFIYGVIYYNIYDKKEAFKKEQEYIDLLQPEYNKPSTRKRLILSPQTHIIDGVELILQTVKNYSASKNQSTTWTYNLIKENKLKHIFIDGIAFVVI